MASSPAPDPDQATRAAGSTEAWPGRAFPLGSTVDAGGTNFAVWSSSATQVWVALFDGDGVETRVELTERIYGIWHGYVPGVRAGQRYGFRTDGPLQPDAGWFHSPSKLLVDPYARSIDGTIIDDASLYPGSSADSAAFVPRCVVVPDTFDWADDQAPNTTWSDSVIYELHVRGFTECMTGVPAELRGTYAGLGHPVAVDTSARSRRHRGRTVAGAPLQRRTRPAATGSGQLLGLQQPRLLRPAHRVREPAVDAGHRGPRRVPRDGQVAARSRHRGHPRRGLQPHRRRSGQRPHRQLPGPGQPRLLPPRLGQHRPVPRLHRLREHRRQPQPAGPDADHGLAAVLGAGHARGRVPLRPGLGAEPRPLQLRRPLGVPERDRPGPGAQAGQADRRTVGRGRRWLPGRRVPAAVE